MLGVTVIVYSSEYAAPSWQSALEIEVTVYGPPGPFNSKITRLHRSTADIFRECKIDLCSITRYGRHSTDELGCNIIRDLCRGTRKIKLYSPRRWFENYSRV